MSGYRRNSYRRGRSSGGGARWMDLRYPGQCSAGGERLDAGARAFYDPSDRSVTCTNLEHAKLAGLTKDVWKGAPGSGQWVETLSEIRIHPGLKDTDGTPLARTSHGLRRGYEHTGHRCEDAPCCGCCD
jgi:hypothetical protein